MAKKRFKKAPLIFTQVHVHFSDLPTRSIASQNELESLHKAMMEIGLADRIDSEMAETGFHLNQSDSDGYFQIRQENQKWDRILFKGFANSRVVELLRNRLTVKTSQYTTYEDLAKFVEQILRVTEEHIVDLSKVLIKQVGIRYIDIVLPKSQKQLEFYIKKELLPYHPEFAEKTIGTSQTVATTGNNRKMVILLEELPAGPQGGPTRWLPPDLMEADNRASMNLYPNASEYGVGNNYGIMSIDHRVDTPDGPKWNIQEIQKNLNDLYELSSDAFWDSITEEAKQEWDVTDG